MSKQNPMQEIRIEKVILHATTSDQEKLEKYKKLLEYLTRKKPGLTKARKRIQAFKIRRGLPMGYKITLRKEKAIEMLKVLLAGIKHKLSKKQVGNGVINFGIKEYILLPGVEYKRDIGILGFDVSVVLAKKGKRVAYRKRCRSKVGKKQLVTKQEAIAFMEKNFGIVFE